jgi:hypothetical protein
MAKEQSILNTLMGRTRKGKKSKKESRKGKKKVAATKMNKTKSANAIPNDNVDVRSSANVKELVDLLKKNKIVIVLVYADWCGHCQTFKKDIWSNLSALPSRKIPMAQIKAEELEKTPLATAEIDGYPTVMMVGQDMKPTNLEDTRNMEMMTKIVNADPNEILNSGSNEETEEKNQNTVPSLDLNEYSTVGTMNTAVPAASPPDIEDDLLTAQTPDNWESINTNRVNANAFTGQRINNSVANGSASGPLMGGSLFASLFNMARNGTGLMGGGATKRTTRRRAVNRRSRHRTYKRKSVAKRG